MVTLLSIRLKLNPSQQRSEASGRALLDDDRSLEPRRLTPYGRSAPGSFLCGELLPRERLARLHDLGRPFLGPMTVAGPARSRVRITPPGSGAATLLPESGISSVSAAWWLSTPRPCGMADRVADNDFDRMAKMSEAVRTFEWPVERNGASWKPLCGDARDLSTD